MSLRITTLLQDLANKLKDLESKLTVTLQWLPYIVQEIWGLTMSQASPTSPSRIDNAVSDISNLSSSFDSHTKYPSGSSPAPASHWAAAVKISGTYPGLVPYNSNPTSETLAQFLDFHRRANSFGGSSISYTEVGANGPQHWANAISLSDGTSVEARISWLLDQISNAWAIKEIYLTTDVGSGGAENVYSTLKDAINAVNQAPATAAVIVYVGRGTFSANEPLALRKDNVAFVSLGDSSKLDFSGGLSLSNCSNIMFENLRFLVTSTSEQITGSNVKNLVFLRCILPAYTGEFSNGEGAFLDLTNSEKIWIQDCYSDAAAGRLLLTFDASEVVILSSKLPLAEVRFKRDETSLAVRKDILIQSSSLKSVSFALRYTKFHNIQILDNDLQSLKWTIDEALYTNYPASCIQVIGNRIIDLASSIEITVNGLIFSKNFIKASPSISTNLFAGSFGKKFLENPSYIEADLANLISENTIVREGTSNSYLVSVILCRGADPNRYDANLANYLQLRAEQSYELVPLRLQLLGNKIIWKGALREPSAIGSTNLVVPLIDLAGTRIEVAENSFYIYVREYQGTTGSTSFDVISLTGYDSRIENNLFLIEGDTTTRRSDPESGYYRGFLRRIIHTKGLFLGVNSNYLTIGGPSTVQFPSSGGYGILAEPGSFTTGTPMHAFVMIQSNIASDRYQPTTALAIDETLSTNGFDAYLLTDNLNYSAP